MSASAIARKIVRIDKDRCNGCGLCVPSCAEGALQVIDGKVGLVSEVYCDGLGACLGECPWDAISIEERVAEEFNLAAVVEYLSGLRPDNRAPDKAVKRVAGLLTEGRTPAAAHDSTLPPANLHACPGAAAHRVEATPAAAAAKLVDQPEGSCLSTWPVQMALVPPTATFLAGADLLVCADCVPFAVPDFHRRYLEGRVALVGCPKLDALTAHRDKLREIIVRARPASVTVVLMEVPCCNAIVHSVVHAVLAENPHLPIEVHTVGIRGGIRREALP